LNPSRPPQSRAGSKPQPKQPFACPGDSNNCGGLRLRHGNLAPGLEPGGRFFGGPRKLQTARRAPMQL
jgi:hypothetical protein